MNVARLLNFLHFRLLNLERKKEKTRTKEYKEDECFTTLMDYWAAMSSAINSWGCRVSKAILRWVLIQLLLDFIIGLSILIWSSIHHNSLLDQPSVLLGVLSHILLKYAHSKQRERQPRCYFPLLWRSSKQMETVVHPAPSITFCLCNLESIEYHNVGNMCHFILVKMLLIDMEWSHVSLKLFKDLVNKFHQRKEY